MFNKITILTAALFAAVSLYAADILLDKARSGDPASQVLLAGEYFYGKKRPQNLQLAHYWFRKAANAGFPAGEYNFALCLKNGWGGEKNLPAAFVYFGRAMKHGVGKAAVHYAELLFSGVESGRLDDQLLPAVAPDRAGALEILRQAAGRNDSEAMLLLAKYLFMDAAYHGRELHALLKKYVEITPDPDPEALLIYAACLRSGIGGYIPDPAEGAKMLQLAADKKHPEATAQLAEMYFHGFGVKIDRERAVKLYWQAVALGSPRAMTDVAQLKMAGHILPHDPAGAFELLTKAAEKNYPPALRKLGDCCSYGVGVERDGKTAIRFYLRAAQAGDAQAAYRLGVCFRDGENTPKDLVSAFNFFQMAARAGHPGGMREAGKALMDGRGVKADPVNGMKLLQKAALAGDREAVDMLR